MSFVKTADSEIISIVKTQGGKDEVISRCWKCAGYHKASETCPVDKEKADESARKDK